MGNEFNSWCDKNCAWWTGVRGCTASVCILDTNEPENKAALKEFYKDYIHRSKLDELIEELRAKIIRVMLEKKSKNRARKTLGYRTAIRYLKKLREGG